MNWTEKRKEWGINLYVVRSLLLGIQIRENLFCKATNFFQLILAARIGLFAWRIPSVLNIMGRVTEYLVLKGGNFP